jgi:thiamine kinase-like enzyme
MNMNKNSELLTLGEATFHNLAREAGIDPENYTRADCWIKNDENRTHTVMRFDGSGQSVVLKQIFRPSDPEVFSRVMDAHQLAQNALERHGFARVPAIIASDVPSRAYLMEFQPGETLREMCLTHEDQTPFLRQAGGWLSAYHQATFQEARPFQPRFMASHLVHLADQVRSGERRVRGKKRFILLAHQVAEMAKDYTGQMSKVAAKHGDLNAHNILIDGPNVAAYDFSPLSYAPVGYDIARLLLSHVRWAVDLDQIPKDHILPPGDLEAFFDGYDFVASDDPGVQFLLRVQLLTDWNRMADKKGAQTLIGFERLRAIARKAFG